MSLKRQLTRGCGHLKLSAESSSREAARALVSRKDRISSLASMVLDEFMNWGEATGRRHVQRARDKKTRVTVFVLNFIEFGLTKVVAGQIL